jgi:hypothetical protein
LKVLIVALLTFTSLTAFSNSEKGKKDGRHEVRKEFRGHPKALSQFDVIPLNSPVKESTAKFLIKVPQNFDIDEISYTVRNVRQIFEKVKPYQKIELAKGTEGKELRINISKLPPGFYQLYVKVKDRKFKEHFYKNKYKDHAMFVIDSLLQVPMPDPKKNDATVAGIDSDNDGIRDDIQRWINEAYSSRPNVKMAMRQIATGRQLDLLAVDNKEQSIIAGKKMLDSNHCLYSIVGLDDGAKLIKELDTKLLNTKDRLYAETKANSNFSGQSYQLPEIEEEKSLCSFNPDSL